MVKSTFIIRTENYREDGPSVIWLNGKEEYYLRKKRHVEDAPAVVFPDVNEEYYRYWKMVCARESAIWSVMW